jgi:hypothetical protein
MWILLRKNDEIIQLVWIYIGGKIFQSIKKKLKDKYKLLF